MTQYVKFISNTQIEYPPTNKIEDGVTICNYNLDVERMIADGYKEFVPATKEEGKSYKITYVEMDNKVIEVAEEIVPTPGELLQQAKEQKIRENDTKRDEALVQGVTYKNVLFDSDTDQKVNLLATVSEMGDTDTIIWFGMDNQPLNCTKRDLFNIGGLITQLHSFCWNKNYEIKTAIDEAETVEEVNIIEVNYNIGE